MTCPSRHGRTARNLFECTLLSTGLLAGATFILAAHSAAAELLSAEQIFAESYHLEQGRGEPTAALAGYRQILECGAAAPKTVRDRALFRIGACQEKLGRYAEARETWSLLLRHCRKEAGVADRARAALAQLGARERQHTIRGTVLAPSSHPVAGAYVLVGDWRRDPPLKTGSTGVFVASRQVEGNPGMNGWPVFAEHPALPLAGFAIARRPAGARPELTVRLGRLSLLHGVVLDGLEGPVQNATIEVDALAPDGGFPVTALIPPVRTDTNGQYEIANLPQGWAYRVRVTTRERVTAQSASIMARSARTRVPVLILTDLGGAKMRGMVVNQRGDPVRTRVLVETMPPENRALSTVETDEAGWYEVGGLPRRPLAVTALGNAEYAMRGLIGVTIEQQSLDFVLGASTSIRALAQTGKPAPELAARSVATSMPVLLAHRRGKAVLLYFWRRKLQPVPPTSLAELHARYAARGLAIICLHDHSGHEGELHALVSERGIPYPLAIDRYAPSMDPAVVSSLTMARYRCEWSQAALIDPEGRLVAFLPLDDGSAADALDRILPAPGPADLPVSAEPAVADGRPAPDLPIAQWYEGATGKPTPPPNLDGRVQVLRFGALDIGPVRFLIRAFGPDAVAPILVLRSDGIKTALERLSQDGLPGAWVAEDATGHAHARYRARKTPMNCVVDGSGRVVAHGCSDAAAFRVVKALLGGISSGSVGTGEPRANKHVVE